MTTLANHARDHFFALSEYACMLTNALYGAEDIQAD